MCFGTAADQVKNRHRHPKIIVYIPNYLFLDYDESSEEEDNVDKSPKVDVNTGNTAVPVETLKTYILQHAADSHFVDEFSVGAMHAGQVVIITTITARAVHRMPKFIIKCE